MKEKCKDFGLSEKAINDLAEAGDEGLTEESSDEDFSAKADSLVTFAKMMQKEITRKSAPKKTQSDNNPSKPEGKDNEGAGDQEEMPAWAKTLTAQMEALTKENAELKAERSKSERKATISAKAKEYGIPEALMKHYNIADDADIDASLTEFKQDLITSNLMPKDAVHEHGKQEAQMQADAKAFAESLPNQ